MSRAVAEAGFSLVETLIVLAIVAALATLAAMSLRSSDDREPSANLPRFIASARSAAILSGRPVAVTFSGQQVRWADREATLVGQLLIDGQAAPTPYELLLYPDGSSSGRALAIERNGDVVAMPGLYRESTR